MKTTTSKKSAPKTSDNQYSFVSRFGIIADSGTTTIPRLITNHYAELGIKPQVAMLIVHIYDFKWDSRDPYPSLEKVAKLMGLTRRAINKYLEELKKKKLLDVYERFDPQFGQQTNIYDFTRLVDKVVKLEQKRLENEEASIKVNTPLNKRSSPPLE
jgi:DNA replication protein